MLTEQDRRLWEQFLTALRIQRAQLERGDYVPLVLVLGQVRGRTDDQAAVGLEVADVSVLSRPDVDPVDVLHALWSAAKIAQSWCP